MDCNPLATWLQGTRRQPADGPRLGISATPLSEIQSARLSPDLFVRPPGFDLATWWQEWAAARGSSRPCYLVTVQVSRELVPYLSHVTGTPISSSVTSEEPTGDRELCTVNLTFETFEDARRQILWLGRPVEVLSRLALRASVADFARKVAAVYGTSDSV